MRTFHLPLPDEVYRDLRQEAIAAFASRYADSKFDLDKDMESASVEHLMRNEKKPQKKNR